MRILFLTLIAVWMALPASTFELSFISEWENQLDGGYLYPHFSADGSVIYMCNGDGIYKYNPETGEQVGELNLEPHNMPYLISSFKMSADRKVFMITDRGGYIYFHDAITDEPLSSITDVGGVIAQRYAISGDGSFALISKYPGELLRWYIKEGAYTMRDSTGDDMLGIGISPDGSLAIRANSRKYRKGLDELYENRIILFDPTTFAAIDTIDSKNYLPTMDSFGSIVLSDILISDDNRFCGLTFNNRPMIIDIENRTVLWYDASQDPVGELVFINGGKSVLVTSIYTYTLKNTMTGEEIQSDSISSAMSTISLDQKYFFGYLYKRLYSLNPTSVEDLNLESIYVGYYEGNLKIIHPKFQLLERVDIIDIHGKSVKVIKDLQQSINGTTELSLELPEGMYICRVKIGGSYESIKFIVSN